MRSHLLALWLASDRQEEFEFRWKFVFGVKSVREVNSTNTAVGVDLNPIKRCKLIIVTEFEECYEFK